MAPLLELATAIRSLRTFSIRPSSSGICSSCLQKVSRTSSKRFTFNPRLPNVGGRRFYRERTPAENAEFLREHREFVSILDKPPVIVRVQDGTKGKGKAFLYLLAMMPITAFALGTWQVQRLDWKTKLIAKLEDQITRPPLPLPPHLDPSAVPDFDHRQVYTRGVFRHDQEMLIGPRLRDGVNGYIVITPLERKDTADTGLEGEGEGKKGGSTILVNRGWISKDMANQEIRKKIGGEAALPTGEVLVEGLLRRPFKKNTFTPSNKPQNGQWYFPDVEEMARHVGAQPVWMQETFEVELFEILHRQSKGIPIGKPPEVELRNTHMQYIVTWYALGLATSVMFYMVVKKPPRGLTQKVRHSSEWA